MFLGREARHCQRISRVPAERDRVQVIVTRLIEGARRLRVEIIDSGRVVSSGTQLVTPVVNRIRLHPHTVATHRAQICFSNPGKGRIAISGGPKRLRGAHGKNAEKRPIAGVIFLRHGSASWVSQTGAIADRYANAQTGPLGGWAVWAAALLALCAAGAGHLVRRRPPGADHLMASTDTKELLRRTQETRERRQVKAPSPPSGRRLPTAAWVCFGVALLNAVAWGLITPLFQVPDEAGHVAYVQRIAETGQAADGEVRHPALLTGAAPADRRNALEGRAASQGRPRAGHGDLPEAPPARCQHLV